MADTGTFTKNEDGTITHTYTRVRTVLIDKEQEDMQGLLTQLAEMPEVKSEPDAETLALWNEQAEQERQQIPDIVERLYWAIQWAKVMEEQGVLSAEEIEKLRTMEEKLKSYE